jgi:hypothetical protein
MHEWTREAWDEGLNLYGPSLENWPMEMQQSVQHALAQDGPFRDSWEQEKHFLNLLRSAEEIPPSWDLSARIIAATQPTSVEKETGSSFMHWLDALFSELMLPRPAYVLSIMIIFGFLIGFSMQPSSVRPDSMKEIQMVREFLYGGTIL